MQQAGDTLPFETAAMRGEIRAQGACHGVFNFIDTRTGRDVIHRDYAALNLFRLFSVNAAMGQPRLMERDVRLMDHGLEVRWPAAEAHHGEIVARYVIATPNAVDLTITLSSDGTYPGYEIFTSSYFDPALVPHIFLRDARYGGRTGDKPQLTVPMVSDVYRGTVIVFPRDAHAARRCVDGRWDRKEFQSPIVQMCPVRHYAMPMAYVADAERDLAVVLMSKRSDCYAISTRYHADDDADRLTPYSAFDFSLFGDDVLPGFERTVTMRLALTTLSNDGPLRAYRDFAGESA